MKKLVVTIAAAIAFALPTSALAAPPSRVAAFRGVPLVDQVTCDPFIPESVTFLVDPLAFPAWSDGLITVIVTKITPRSVSLRADRPIAGVIVVTDHGEFGYRTRGSRVRLHVAVDTLSWVYVCFFRLPGE